VIRGAPVPLERLPIVLRDAEPEIVDLPHLELGWGEALRRRLADPVDRLRGVVAAVVQQRAQRELRDDVAAGRGRAGGLERARHVGIRRSQQHDGKQERTHVARNYTVTAIAAVLAIATLSAQTPAKKELDVIYVPTPQPVVEAMLDLAQVKATDVVYDLGSGDGRIVVTAAKKYGARGVGVEMDPALVKQARANAAAAGVGGRVRFVTQDLFTTDLRQASVVTLYLLQSINERLRPKLVRELKPGARVVSHVFNMGPEWPAEKTITIDRSRVFLWSIGKR
jgi:predicted nicotinamide N-methyase